VIGRIVGVERHGKPMPLRSLGLRLHLLARRMRMALERK
jgi:hypothetical protein